ncbi:MAG: shikimate kinase [Clostridia bacterium]|nr:shikimate kinase [Clostridia bacterium]
MMGCGKTTVAEVFSARGYTVVDTDQIIVERYGNIDGIFAQFGEAHFRELEAAVTAEVAQKYNNAVISLGGGCVLRAENVKNLKATGKIFYLKAQAETLIKRLKGDTTRPLLKGGLEEKVNSILSARARIYESVADVVIDTDTLTPAEVAIKIEEKVL